MTRTTMICGWRTIDSAPKNGTPILIWNKKWDMALLARWEMHPDAENSSGKVQDYYGRLVNIKGWVHKYIPWPQCPGKETYFLGWPEDKEEGNMPTHWCYPPTEEKTDD